MFSGLYFYVQFLFFRNYLCFFLFSGIICIFRFILYFLTLLFVFSGIVLI
ncbi:unnamed protein product [Meloidogyne enterolobii]|uniref:Uncharacterized protein n=1 Tax=Meloidogyne enterolobii TaxID=390850 RepID=A0ACB0XZS8_MELEN